MRFIGYIYTGFFFLIFSHWINNSKNIFIFFSSRNKSSSDSSTNFFNNFSQNIWLNKLLNCSFYIGDRIDELDRRIREIRLPKLVRRNLRPLSERKYYKANEWRIILLFIAYPILTNIFPDRFASIPIYFTNCIMKNYRLLNIWFIFFIKVSRSLSQTRWCNSYTMRCTYYAGTNRRSGTSFELFLRWFWNFIRWN